jgi:type I restriction enzyme S subunit
MSDLIPDGWRSETIGTYVSKMVGGAPLRPSDFSKAGVRVIPKKAVQFGGKTKFKVKTYCTPDFASNNQKNIVNNEYIITSLRDLVPTGPTIGVISKLEDKGDFILAQGVYGLKTKNMVDDYLIQLSNSQWYRQAMRLIFVGSTQVHIRNQEFLDVLIPVPPLPEQQKIAAILTSVDEVIEKIQAQINKLKDLKTGMMQELLTKGIGHTEFKDSPVGRIPLDWKVECIGDLAEQVKPGPFGSSLTKAMYVECGYKVYGQEQIIAGDLNVGHYYVDKEKYDSLGVFKVQAGEILISLVGTFGKVVVVPEKFEEGIINPRLLKLRFDQSSVNPDFIAYQLRSDFVLNQLNQLQQGGTMGVLSATTIKPVKLIVPPLSVQLKISTMLSSINKSLYSKNLKLDSTKNVKKALMQDLLTGKVRVNTEKPNAEVAVD